MRGVVACQKCNSQAVEVRCVNGRGHQSVRRISETVCFCWCDTLLTKRHQSASVQLGTENSVWHGMGLTCMVLSVTHSISPKTVVANDSGSNGSLHKYFERGFQEIADFVSSRNSARSGCRTSSFQSRCARLNCASLPPTWCLRSSALCAV